MPWRQPWAESKDLSHPVGFRGGANGGSSSSQRTTRTRDIAEIPFASFDRFTGPCLRTHMRSARKLPEVGSLHPWLSPRHHSPLAKPRIPTLLLIMNVFCKSLKIKAARFGGSAAIGRSARPPTPLFPSASSVVGKPPLLGLHAAPHRNCEPRHPHQ